MNPPAPTPGTEPDGDDMAMPASDAPGTPAAPPVPPPPTPFGRQMAQLVIIPAVIVIIAVGIAVLFGVLAGAPDSIENHLMRLKQTSGAGRMAFNVQDPRYKDRCYAAANIAQMLPTITAPAARADLSRQLVEVLKTSVGEQEYELQSFLLLAVGELGQPDAQGTILKYAQSPSGMVRMAVPRAMSAWSDAGRTPTQWPNRAAARQAAMPVLVKLVQDREPSVAAEAARVIGVLCEAGDPVALTALREGLTRMGQGGRVVQWNAAIALARLGEEDGGRVVAEVLLNREALAKLPSSDLGGETRQSMDSADQDHVILQTLASVPGSESVAGDARVDGMKSELVWNRIRLIADSDKNLAIRNAAVSLVNWKNGRGVENPPTAKNPGQ
ncbi:MAG: hypothetical protein K8S99_01145 [Planctomycetes bacterium]|nr:hypothetical protein [Planctomycetota bacterium]